MLQSAEKTTAFKLVITVHWQTSKTEVLSATKFKFLEYFVFFEKLGFFEKLEYFEYFELFENFANRLLS